MGPTVDVVSSQLQKYEENLSDPLWACISSVEKLSQQVHYPEEHTSSSSPRWSSILAIKSHPFPAQVKEYQGCKAGSKLWLYLRDHGKDVRKWDGKPTSNLVARVCELQGNTIAKMRSPRKITAPVSVGQSRRGSRRANVISDPDEGTSASHLQELNDRHSNQD